MGVAGEITVNVSTSLSSKKAIATLVAIEGSGLSLFGRNLLALLDLNIKTHHTTTTLSDMAKSVTSSFPSLFQPDLECFKDNTFSLSVDPSVAPKFCKAQPIIYALRAKVDAELDGLHAEGIITPVKYSDWAAAIVPVVKTEWLNRNLWRL